MGEVFRARLRQFPALVNCCTIDWFSQWPMEGLVVVAHRFLQDLHNDIDLPMRNQISLYVASAYGHVIDGLTAYNDRLVFSNVYVSVRISW